MQVYDGHEVHMHALLKSKMRSLFIIPSSFIYIYIYFKIDQSLLIMFMHFKI
jgi:hypothetical protein